MKQALWLTLSVLIPCGAWASMEAEFNSSFLYGAVDTDVFRYGNPIGAGEYLADIYVNDEYRGQRLITFVQADGLPMRGLCLSDELLSLIDVKPEYQPKTPIGACRVAVDFHKDIEFLFDVATHRLNISAPQTVLMSYPKGYIPRSAWQTGVPATFLKYRFNHSHYDNDYTSSEHGHLGVQTGANFGGHLGAWSFRQSGSLSWQDGRRGNYQHHHAFMQRDIDKYHGRLTIGDFYTQSTLLDNIGMRGVAMNFDTRMLPYAQTGYAPQIQGVANSNARVSIRQNGNVIYETNVPAGVFVIEDLNTLSSTSGDLTMTVVEADGTSHVSVVPYSSTSQMLRPRQFRYQVALGQYRRQSEVADGVLLHGSMQYGVNNHVTLQTGVIAHDDYWSNTLGGVFGGKFGAVSGDLTATTARIHAQKMDNARLHLGYTKYFQTPKTYVNADLYHYFKPNEIYLSHALLPSWHGEMTHTQQGVQGQYRLSVNQSLGRWGGMYVSGLYNDVYGDDDVYNYQLGYSGSVQRWQYQLGLSRTYRPQTDQHDDMVYASVHLPFFHDNHPSSVSARYQRTDERDYVSASYHQHFGKLNQYHYGISTTQSDEEKPSVSAHAGASLPMAQLDVSASRHDKDTQYSYGVSGAVVAHKHGVTLGHELGDTFAIIHAKGAKGTPIVGGQGAKIDRFGNGVVSYLYPYHNNHIALDASGLPDDVEIGETGRELVPRANGVYLVEFKTDRGQLVLFEMLGDRVIPAMTEAKNDKGEVVGHTTHDGRLLARLSDNKGNIRLTWADGACGFGYDIQAGRELSTHQVVCDE